MDAEQKLHQFETQVRREVAAHFPETALSVTAKGKYRLKLRIELSREVFIDIFYNPHNDRTDFTRLAGQRGYNVRGKAGRRGHAVGLRGL